MADNKPTDAVELTRALIRCASVTPVDGGALGVTGAALERLGFTTHAMTFSAPDTPDVDNLYARLGDSGPNFCFAGHTDVVPVGDADAWSLEPFAADIRDGILYGRGATDMKGAVAAFIAAVDVFLAKRGGGFDGSISLLITGDEEGPSINGTVKVLEWLAERGEKLDHCLVGEPTNPESLGDMVKIGRRGSMTGTLSVRGVQGHVAYPHLADNPLPRLIKMLDRLSGHVFDTGNDHFTPTNLELASIDVGNTAANVIPAHATALFNIRFNTEQTSDGLEAWLRQQCDAVGGDYDLNISVGAQPFLTVPGPFTDLISRAVEDVTGTKPALTTTGGTSDARFIHHHCPVAEFGLISESMHKVDEQASVSDIERLTGIYAQILDYYFDSNNADGGLHAA
ncbi:MAG: succinyl-diaminopimelate desuccinylase [Rhodospirillaceae bacterium]|mgnify:FL=1|jgi:succinyl-diaminopimelate desuccinylase|nr:succinyl-diaminopimelate desuccinylase [Rhodospirillaceae bacterium]MBT4490825.1 succinyl-diaminopimelate desuccinylase [Rhodospirillaceae bacterium]MBT5192130.1 succinyl-diaminopimelate desuccinylase [Rhodospirillaceae bacterium]MBT5894937.1 succinyl-diaminopimelate desuccinylase [Rhodospirillaceae bacterium]MBT6428450.1 succinyl-diaminopimelate desuccinylase [Rhodospirillaceae bacterium]